MWETVIAGVILSVWAVGAGWRVRRQARYFQIEEYKNLRYLIWVIRRRAQIVPTRILMAGAGGAVLSIFFSEAPNSPLPYVIGLIAAVVALSQPREAEVKKPLRITARVRRLLGVTWGVIAVLSAAILGISRSLTGDTMIAAICLGGMIVSILAPLCW